MYGFDRMLTGHDFARFGSQYDTLNRIGDGHGSPVQGPIRLRWIGREYILVIDPSTDVYILSVTGNVLFILSNGIKAEAARQRRLANASNVSDAKESERHYEYWFEDPVHTMSKEEKQHLREEAEAAKALEQYHATLPPRKKQDLDIEALDACLIPAKSYDDPVKMLMSCDHSGSLKLFKKGEGDRWEEYNKIGSRQVLKESTGEMLPGMFDKISGVDSVLINNHIYYFSCDESRHRIHMFDEDGKVLYTYGGEGLNNMQFRRPSSISVCILKPKRIVNHFEREEEEERAYLREKAKAKQDLLEKHTETKHRTYGLGTREVGSYQHISALDEDGDGDVSDGEIDRIVERNVSDKQKGGNNDAESKNDDNNYFNNQNKMQPAQNEEEVDIMTSSLVPEWYLGFGTSEDMLFYLKHKTYGGGHAGDFCVCRRLDNAYVWDLYYITQDHVRGEDDLDDKNSVGRIVIRKQHADEDRDIKEGYYQGSTSGVDHNTKVYESIWDFVKAQKYVRLPIWDPRPYCKIAVADKGNARVQIYRYFWTQSDVYVPSFEYFGTIGGPCKTFYPLRWPHCVTFAPTGELSIIDKERVLLFSDQFTFIMELDLPFISKSEALKKSKKGSRDDNAEDGDGDAEVKGRFLKGGEWPYWISARQKAKKVDEHVNLVAESLGEYNAKDRKEDKREGFSSPKKKVIVKRDVYGKVIEEIEDTSDHHMIPCTAAFSPDGFFAVGYKNGGIVLYRKYKTYNTGNFLHLPLPLFDQILDFLDYESVCQMRNCCRFMHNHTKRMRSQWCLNPMRPDKYDSVLFHFLRWAVNKNDDRQYYGTNPMVMDYLSQTKITEVCLPRSQQRQKNADERKRREEAKNAAEQKFSEEKTDGSGGDAKGKDSKDSKEDDLKITPKDPDLVMNDHSKAATFTDTSHCYPFVDHHRNIICEKYLQRTCVDKYCRRKHCTFQPIGYVQHYPPVEKSGIEYKHLLLASYNIHGPKFVWSRERYIEALFQFYSIPVSKLVRHDNVVIKTELTKDQLRNYNRIVHKRDTLREAIVQEVPLLSLEFYMEIMHYLEEDFGGVKSVERHPLFFRTRPEDFKPYGPYDMESIEKRIVVDKAEQYDMSDPKNRINVPYTPLRPGNASFVRKMGMNNLTRGTEDGDVDNYCHTFEHQAEKVNELMLKLFK